MNFAARSLLALLALTAAPASAERADREKEIVIGADKSIADDKAKVLTFDGNVVITQGTMRITAARVTMKEDGQRHKFYVATGAPVTFRQKKDKVDEWVEGTAERAEFDDRNDTLKLYNRAHVRSGDNQLTGDFISYDMRKEVAEVLGAAPGKAPPSDSRVKVIIVPAKKAPEGADRQPTSPVLKTDPGKP